MPRPTVDVQLLGHDRTRNAFRSVERNLGALTGGVGGLNRAFGGFGLGAVGALTAVGTAVVAVNRQMNETVNRLDSIDKASRDAGVDPETLQTWRIYGQLVGATTQQVDTALRRFRRRLGEAQQGQAVASVFESLDVEVRNVDGSLRSLDQVFADTVQSLASAENPTVAFASALRIFDTEGARLVTGLIEQNTVLSDVTAQIENLNAIHTNETVRAVAGVKDEITLTNEAFRVAYERFIVEILPAWNRFRTVAVEIGTVLFALRKGPVDGFIEALRLVFGMSTQEAIADTEEKLAGVNAQLESMGSLLDAEDSEEYVNLLGERARLEVDLRRLRGETAEAGKAAADAAGEESDNAAILTDRRREELDAILAKEQAVLRAVGHTADEARLIELRRDLEEASTDQERAKIRAIIAVVEQRIMENAALEEAKTINEAIARVTGEIASLSGDDEQILLNRLGITREMLAENEQLRMLFEQLLMLSRGTEMSLAERIQGQLQLIAEQDEFNKRLNAALGVMVMLGAITKEVADEIRRALGGEGRDDDDGDDGVIDDDRLKRIEEDIKTATKFGVEQGFYDAIESGDLNDFFDALGRQLLITVNQNIIDGILMGFDDGAEGGGLLGLIGNIFSRFGGGRQQGGPVRSGQFYVVGEEGPEILVPGGAGQVIPNSGVGGIVLHQTNNISGVRETEQIYNFIELSNEKLKADLYADAKNGRLPR